MYPDRKGPFSLALTAEAAFAPFIKGRDRAEKIRRTYALTIPDYTQRGHNLREPVRWASEPVEGCYPKATGSEAHRTGRFTIWLKCYQNLNL